VWIGGAGKYGREEPPPRQKGAFRGDGSCKKGILPSMYPP
jgi:hypothetical protein